MSVKEQSRSLLTSKDVSITNPRLIVLSILLRKGDPLTIDQILKASRGKLAQSTVYRVINDLQKFGLISEFTNPENATVIELNKEDAKHHHHLFCKNCRRIIDIELDRELEDHIQSEVLSIEEQYSLSIDGHSLELLGLCNFCS